MPPGAGIPFGAPTGEPDGQIGFVSSSHIRAQTERR
jgi:hypothetical protein